MSIPHFLERSDWLPAELDVRFMASAMLMRLLVRTSTPSSSSSSPRGSFMRIGPAFVVDAGGDGAGGAAAAAFGGTGLGLAAVAFTLGGV